MVDLFINAVINRKASSINSLDEIISWITSLNNNINVSIEKVSMNEDIYWFYDEGEGIITNKNKSFFQICGIVQKLNGEIISEQPILIQDEIGYLGIICKEFNGVLHFLMQAKIEPGNINKIQISPTIQATKSNFTQKHGGSKPPYLEYFNNADEFEIIVDQIQSEQSSRFYKKRNRNIIILLDEDQDVEILPNYKWITFFQLKELMQIDNLVNMDTRTVISCIPYYKLKHTSYKGDTDLFNDTALYNSIMELPRKDSLYEIYHYMNNYKMFNNRTLELVPLHLLKKWSVTGNEFVCCEPYSFKVIFCDIAIEGREVKQWTQPLFEATGIATFGLLTCVENDIRKFLVNCRPEIGCFDQIEIGPTVQREYIDNDLRNNIDDLFYECLETESGIIFDTLLSEEGGRFYHEQNRNVIIEISPDRISKLPQGYFWTTYRELNELVQINNCLNIQLRNLLSVLPF